MIYNCFEISFWNYIAYSLNKYNRGFFVFYNQYNIIYINNLYSNKNYIQ